MHRRQLLGFLGAAAVAPLLAPLSVRERLSAGEALHRRATAQSGRALSVEQLALVTALADTILPRTDTPGALDVGVPAFVDLLAAEWYPDQDRRELLSGLDGLDAKCQAAQGKLFAALDAAGREAFLRGVDGQPGGATTPEGAYRRLKEAIVFGYLTSKPVYERQRTTPIMPARFDGCIPVGGPQ